MTGAALPFVVLPATFLALRARTTVLAAALISVGVTGLGFSLWHPACEASSSPVYSVTRFVVPDAAMSALWFLSPSLIVTAHATAHLLLPALFA